MKRSNPIILKLEGGLGNQLFELAAGYYLAAKLDSDLHIDQYSIPLTTVHGETGSGYEPFESLQLPKSLDVRLLPELPRRFVIKLAKRSTFIKRIVTKIRILRSNPNKLELFLETNDVDSTNQFFNIENPVKLHGNFQSWEIVERAAQFGFPRTFQLRKTPHWIIDLARNLDFGNSLVLHFRVGDDTRTNYNFKQPDILYYLKAIDTLRLKKNFTSTYILSDDVNRVKMMFGNKLDKGIRYLEMPDESSPAERLYVLSLFGGIVCANSTFCGWAAWSISNSGGEVVVPIPYSDGPVLGSRDFPYNWIKLDKYSGAELT